MPATRHFLSKVIKKIELDKNILKFSEVFNNYAILYFNTKIPDGKIKEILDTKCLIKYFSMNALTISNVFKNLRK